jgi:hypothetical protein
MDAGLGYHENDKTLFSWFEPLLLVDLSYSTVGCVVAVSFRIS